MFAAARAAAFGPADPVVVDTIPAQYLLLMLVLRRWQPLLRHCRWLRCHDQTRA